MSTISARLEEVENDNSNQIGRQPTRNVLDKYTPGPMPPIQDAHPTAPFDNIDINLIKEWECHLGGKLIAVPFDMDALKPRNHEYLRMKILTVVVEITNAQEASVVAPRPSQAAKKANRLPTSFLVYNITSEQSELLLQRRVWSSRAITFRVTPFAPTCPTFLFALRGFMTIVMKDVYPIVKQVWESELMKTFTTTLTNAVLENEKQKVTLKIDHLLTTMNLIRLDIKEAGNTLNLRFNVYADSSKISHDEVWRRLRTYLFNQTYSLSMQGQGTAQHIPFVCTCCHGADHPRGLCPFPNVTGWNSSKRENGGDFPKRRNGGFFNIDQRSQNVKFFSHT